MKILIINVISGLIIIVPILLSVAYLTLAERKIMGSLQRRVGPNIVGYYGLLQPFADALKLVVKETVYPKYSNKLLFILSPILSFVLSILGWLVIPLNIGIYISKDEIIMNNSILYILAISSLGVYGIIYSGWAANSKYAFIGSIRSTAQMISYEIALGLIILNVIILNGTTNLNTILLNQISGTNIYALLPLMIMFIISALAETNRAPFDLPEAESELTAGFMTEHSSLAFAYFFLAEYANIILISTLSVILFLGLTSISLLGSLYIGIKVSIILFIFIWVRASFPRYRYDQLIKIMWLNYLPLIIGIIILIPGILII